MKITRKNLENLIIQELNDLKENRPGMKVRDPRTEFEQFKDALKVLTLPHYTMKDSLRRLFFGKDEKKAFQKLLDDASDVIKNLQKEFKISLPDKMGAPPSFRMSGGLDVSLEEKLSAENKIQQKPDYGPMNVGVYRNLTLGKLDKLLDHFQIDKEIDTINSGTDE
tara:strand:+ start:1069 stop:1566 length:498 start_codon:yes stop_codon:yes gene_type:complete